MNIFSIAPQQRPVLIGLSKPVEPKMSSQVLTKMLELIRTGQLSHEDVIEEMINNGLLPVDVTEIGKIPISVGTFPKKDKPENVSPLLRLQNLRARNPTTSNPLPSHEEMIDVDLTDPDGDFENMSEHLEEGVDPGLSAEPDKNEKDIEALDSMMKLFDQVHDFNSLAFRILFFLKS